ncbi:MAG: amino acid adenylation domain-containing protein [Caldilineaceae bacterium]
MSQVPQQVCAGNAQAQAAGKNASIEDMYPLSPSQQGMLLDTLSNVMAPGAAGPTSKYVEIAVFALFGPLDVAAFHQAWQIVVQRHTALRTGFVWKAQSEPVQFVLKTVQLPLDVQDWRAFTVAEQQAHQATYLERLQTQGFTLTKPPLLHLALWRLTDDCHRFVWAMHHILSDGWCIPVVLGEVMACYRAQQSGQPVMLPPAQPYRTYIHWLRQQNEAAAKCFWQDYLADFHQPTALGTPAAAAKPPAALPSGGRYGKVTGALSLSTTETLQALVQQQQLTLNTLAQGVWALLLQHYSNQTDVVFGATVAGRPAEISRVETMVGLFINTLPIRLAVALDTPLFAWLAQCQTQRLAAERYAHCSAGQIQAWSGFAATTPLFSSLLVFQNYPKPSATAGRTSTTLDFVPVDFAGAHTAYPLTVMVTPTADMITAGAPLAGLTVEIIYDGAYFADADVQQVLDHWLLLLHQIAERPDQTPRQLVAQLPIEQIPHVYAPAAPTADQPYVAPRTAVEAQLVQIWLETLGLQEDAANQRPLIGIDDTFFALGGHSLVAMQMVARIRGTFGVELPLQSLFQTPTIRGLAVEIVALQQAQQHTTRLPLVAQPRDAHVPLSYAQQRLWFMEQMAGSDPAYQVPVAFQLTGALDVPALQTSLHAIVQRHEVLRTRYQVHEGEVYQVITPADALTDLAFPLIPVDHLSADEQQALVVQWQQTLSEQPFDLAVDLPIRGALLRLATDRHVLLLTLHHIASDGWSMEILRREVAALYSALRQQQASPLPPLPLQYADFAIWQRQFLATAEMQAHWAYWKSQLGGELPTLNLPLDFPRPAQQNFRGGQCDLLLAPPISAGCRQLSQQQGVTLFMTLLAAFKLLLARVTGQSDIIVGSPSAGRSQVEIEELIGCFLNTIVLRTDLSTPADGPLTFLTLLERVKQVTLAAYAHQAMPFEKLVEELQPVRDPSRTPLFQVWCNMAPEESPVHLPGLTMTPLAALDAPATFDLTFYMQNAPDGIRLRLLYNANLFTRPHMAELLQQFELLLGQLLAAPEQPVDTFSLVTPTAASRLPDPSQPLPEPAYKLVPATIAALTARTPYQPAVEHNGEQWSYATLLARSEAIAGALVAAGLQPGDVVAILGRRSFGQVASMVGVLRSGGVLLLLDPNLPSQRWQVMQREANARYLLCLEAISPEVQALADACQSLLVVDPQSGQVAGAIPTTTTLLPTLTPDAPAYIFFTSGSTGVPKGVLGTHKGLAHFLHWQRQTFAITPTDRIAQLIALSFDAVLRDTFLPLTSGAPLVLPPAEAEAGLTPLLVWLQQAQITLIHTVPALAQGWLAAAPAEVTLPALRYIFLAGEPLTEPVVRQWRERAPTGEVINLYGPTETTMVKCFYRIPATIPPGVQLAGFPQPQTQALVLRDGRLCGIGEPGEIVIRTPFRTLGYINNAAEQQRRFVPNPFRDDAQDLLYYTGDVGCYRADGALEIRGRLDDQVKVRGVRIELKEIEVSLQQHPAVQQCAVTVFGEGMAKLLIAYLVPKPTSSVEAVPSEQTALTADLRNFLRQRLPDYMMPAVFVLLKALPLTPSGKVNHKALPAPDLHKNGSETYQAPRTPTERTLAEIWQTLLKAEAVGIADDFFALGGHSLLATQVLARIRHAFGVDLPMRTFFQTPTIPEIAQQIELLQTAQKLQTMAELATEAREEIAL